MKLKKARIWVSLPAPAIVYRARPEGIEERDRAIREHSETLEETVEIRTAELKEAVVEAERANEAYARALDAAGGLIEQPDILAKFSEAIGAAGVVGETRTARLLYLALTSRFFARPISIAIKGPSSAGKGPRRPKLV